jgi:dimethylaniline monooxygenase (N-oxide forming)
MSRENEAQRVCVIGAGPSGLAVCKTLQGAGIPFDCFEANRSVGGIWDVEGSSSGGYRSLSTNTSKTKMAFSDFPFPDDAPQFLGHDELLDYFNAYVDHFGFRDSIQFKSCVVSARPTEDGRWRVVLANDEERNYAACIVATGQYGTRRWPEPRPPGEFSGSQIHAADYLDPETPIDCRGKRVVIVGLGSSAAEIATELGGGMAGPSVASNVVLSARSGRYVLPKLFRGQPLDASAPHPSDRLPEFIGRLPKVIRTQFFRTLFKRAIGKVEREVGRPSTWNLPNPTFGVWAERPTLSDGFIPALEAGRIEARPGIAAFDESAVRFTDASESEADVIIWATGYRPGFPFLDEDVLGCPDDELALYRRIAHPTQPNLFFIGFTRVSCSLWPVSEQQAGWLIDVLRGRIALPSPVRQTRASVQVSKALPVFCSAYTFDLKRDRR